MKTRNRGEKKELCWLTGQLLFLFLFFFVLVFPIEAAEIPYPVKHIRVISPWGTGSTGDLAPRVISEKMAEFLKQPLFVENKPGGGGITGTSFVAKEKPDGYTVLAASSSPLLLSPIVRKKDIDYEFDDFIHGMVIGKGVNWLAVKPDARWKNLKEFVEEEKKSPGKLKVSSYGVLTPGEFAIKLLNKYEGINLNLIPFRSAYEALVQLMGGHVDAAIVGGTGGMLESGRIRMLAVAEEVRLPDYPNIPTFKELGYPIVVPSGRYWFCFPKGTPMEIVEKFCKAHEDVGKNYSKEITEKLKRIEMWAEFLNRDQTITRLEKDSEMYLNIVKELGIIGK